MKTLITTALCATLLSGCAGRDCSNLYTKEQIDASRTWWEFTGGTLATYNETVLHGPSREFCMGGGGIISGDDYNAFMLNQAIRSLGD